MRRRLAYVLASLATVVGLSSAVLVGCGQAIGEKCQIDSDCTSDLCNQGTGLCQAPNAGDAPVIPGPDAKIDGGPADASPDAKPVDAKPVDAMPTPDA